MGWLMDVIMAIFVLLVIILNTKKGCKTILSLLVTAGAFAAACFFGPDVGEFFMTDIVKEKAAGVIHSLLVSVVGEAGETVTVADLCEQIPESFAALLERVGADAEMLAESFGEMTVISDNTLTLMADKLAVPVSRFIANALGCIAVFIAAWLVLLIVKWIIEQAIKLPGLKQASSILGFLLGVVKAFAWSWVICMAVGALIEYSLLGEYNAFLTEIAENSYTYNFFRDFSLVDLLSITK